MGEDKLDVHQLCAVLTIHVAALYPGCGPIVCEEHFAVAEEEEQTNGGCFSKVDGAEKCFITLLTGWLDIIQLNTRYRYLYRSKSFQDNKKKLRSDTLEKGTVLTPVCQHLWHRVCVCGICLDFQEDFWLPAWSAGRLIIRQHFPPSVAKIKKTP